MARACWSVARGAITSLIGTMDDTIDEMNRTAAAIELFDVQSFDPQMKQIFAFAAENAPPELAVEIVQFLLSAGRFAALEAFLAKLPAAVAEQERIVLARASVAAERGDLDTLETLLKVEFATIREGENLSADLWAALQKGRLMQTLGRAPTPAEMEMHEKAHPLPEHLDFRMRVTLEDGTN